MEYVIEKDVVYRKNSTNPKHCLDIYRPKGAVLEKLPTVLYFHGGGWEFGDKSQAIARLENFYDTGYLFVGVGYRLCGEAHWPAMMDDAVAALEYVMSHIPDVDTARVALWGSSAGGHIAGLLAGGCRATEQPNVRCLVNYCGPVTVESFVQQLEGEEREMSPVMKMLGGDHELTESYAKEATVTQWVKPGYPPTLSVHGDRDQVVPLVQSQVLTKAIQEAGSEAALLIAEDCEHRVQGEAVRTAVKGFLAKHFV